MFLKVVCVWCGKFMDTRDTDQADEPTLPITHTICPERARKVREAMKMTFPPSLKPTNNN
jgi:hypothetical protein